MTFPSRRFAIGAELTPDGVGFRVWAPKRRRVAVRVEPTRDADGRDYALEPENNGYFSGFATGLRAGTHYKYQLDDDRWLYPDPASRFQPEGPHGPSQVVDPTSFPWSDAEWRGVSPRGQVIYELHVGTFTPTGTWLGALERLPHLAELGVTLIEILPVADFGGEFGWGYDGVNLFAPCRLYGVPDDFRKFVDRAHALQMGVILDVVYNHLGPDGNYLAAFSDDYFTSRHKTDWGEAINYDGANSGPVRELMITNAAYWIREFHLDGLRLDATQNIYDSSDCHLIAEISRAAREAAAPRSIYITAENEEQRVRHIQSPSDGGCGLDSLWNDDFHHSAVVALTGHSEAYYSDYRGCPQELLSAVKHGFLYQSQRSRWQEQGRGTPSRQFAPERFVTYIENHDQVANGPGSLRLSQTTSPELLRAMTAFWLLTPGTPMLFQGQEFAASTPFYFFAGHGAELAMLVDAGRKEFLSQFPSQATPEAQARIPNPADRATFEQSRLDWSECERNAHHLALHHDLLQLRREDPVLSRQSGELDGAVLSSDAFIVRFFAEDGADRLLLVNLGKDFDYAPCPEPLLAPPIDLNWSLAWSSEDPRYGGHGTPSFQTETGWFLPGRSALFLIARKDAA